MTATQESVLKYLLECNREITGKVSIAANGYDVLSSQGIPQTDFMDAIQYLNACHYIKIYWHGHAGVSTMCDITLLDKALNYFEEKESEIKKHKEEKRDNSIWKGVAIGVGIMAVERLAEWGVPKLLDLLK